MAYNEELADLVRETLASHRAVRDQKMFGGIGFMVDDKMVAGVHGPDLIVRVPADEHDRAVKEPGARTMDITGRPMKGFLFIGPAGTKTGASVKKWIERSAGYVATLPARKKPTKKKRT
jgi:TfoX/Sxy family transcriptional regulator of competence genes